MSDFSFANDRWRIIEETVESILRNEVARYSFQSVHHAVFQLCQARCGSILSDGLEEVLRTHAICIRDRLLGLELPQFLSGFAANWSDYHNSLRRISDVLLFFNKHYVQRCHRQSVQEVGEHLYCSIVFGKPEITARLLSSVALAVKDDQHRDVLQNYAKELFYMERGCYYEPYMENPYISLLTERYVAEGQRQTLLLPVPDYVRWVNGVVGDEKQKAEHLLCGNSLRKVEVALYEALVTNTCGFLLHSESGCVGMLRSWDLTSLQQLIDLTNQSGDTQRVLDVAMTAVKQKVEAALGAGASVGPVQAVSEVLELLQRSKELSGLFPSFGESLTSPIIRVLHDTVNNSTSFGEMVALFLDSKIRSAKKEDLDHLFDETISLCSILRDQDMLELALRNQLATRLIHAKPDALAAENQFLARLKKECGPGFASRLERMVADLTSGTELNAKLIRAISAVRRTLPLDFHAAILTGGFWPQYPTTRMRVTRSMETCMEVFQEFYVSRHNGRKLSFQLSLGTVVFELVVGGKVYQVSAQTPFVHTIEALNSDEPVSLEQISETSLLPIGEVESQLKTLQRVGLVVQTGTAFHFNTQFTSPKPKVRVSAAVQKGAKEMPEHGHVKKGVECTRSPSIDAQIVRAMKERKNCPHDALCTMVAESLKNVFSPSMSDIKSRIEILIEKGFLTRSGVGGVYVYTG